jgi:hypothetical protein
VNEKGSARVDRLGRIRLVPRSVAYSNTLVVALRDGRQGSLAGGACQVITTPSMGSYVLQQRTVVPDS